MGDKIFGYTFDELNAKQMRRGSLTRVVDTNSAGDYGADPMGDGTFRMVPSGEIVGYEERCMRLKPK